MLCAAVAVAVAVAGVGESRRSAQHDDQCSHTCQEVTKHLVLLPNPTLRCSRRRNATLLKKTLGVNLPFAQGVTRPTGSELPLHPKPRTAKPRIRLKAGHRRAAVHEGHPGVPSSRAGLPRITPAVAHATPTAKRISVPEESSRGAASRWVGIERSFDVPSGCHRAGAARERGAAGSRVRQSCRFVDGRANHPDAESCRTMNLSVATPAALAPAHQQLPGDENHEQRSTSSPCDVHRSRAQETPERGQGGRGRPPRRLHGAIRDDHPGRHLPRSSRRSGASSPGSSSTFPQDSSIA